MEPGAGFNGPAMGCDPATLQGRSLCDCAVFAGHAAGGGSVLDGCELGRKVAQAGLGDHRAAGAGRGGVDGLGLPEDTGSRQPGHRAGDTGRHRCPGLGGKEHAGRGAVLHQYNPLAQQRLPGGGWRWVAATVYRALGAGADGVLRLLAGPGLE